MIAHFALLRLAVVNFLVIGIRWRCVTTPSFDHLVSDLLAGVAPMRLAAVRRMAHFKRRLDADVVRYVERAFDPPGATGREVCGRRVVTGHLPVDQAHILGMLKALEEHMPKHPEISWTKSEGGLFLWVNVPSIIDVDELFYEALEEKVAYVVGTGFYTDGGGKHAFRVNFSYPTEDEINAGVQRLAKVINKRLNG